MAAHYHFIHNASFYRDVGGSASEEFVLYKLIV